MPPLNTFLPPPGPCSVTRRQPKMIPNLIVGEENVEPAPDDRLSLSDGTHIQLCTRSNTSLSIARNDSDLGLNTILSESRHI